MKTKMLFLVTFLFVFFGCTNDEDQTVAINGKLVSAVTRLPVANSRIAIRTYSIKGDGQFSYTVHIDSTTVYSDDEGNFSANLHVSNSNDLVGFYKFEDDISTPLITGDGFKLSEVQNKTVTLTVRKFEKLKIRVKSVNPFDANDQISVRVLENNTNIILTKIFSIENLGAENLPWEDTGYNDGLNPWWKGTNVDSVINHAIQEGTQYRVFWYVRKNGISTTNFSDAFTTLSGSLNEFEINY